jgi:ABC-type transport system substrate-binding protein
MSKNKKSIETWFKFRLNRFRNWFSFQQKIFQLWWADAPKYQKDIEKGNYYLRRGAVYQVGQPFTVKDRFGTRQRYIDNLFFDFKKNKITHKFSKNPIKGFTEQFES